METSSPAAFYVGGVRVHDVTLDGSVKAISAGSAGGMVAHLCNAYTIAVARRDPAYRAQLNEGELNLPDGTPVSWVMRGLGSRVAQEPVRGADLMREVLRVAATKRHYFYGGAESVVARLAAVATTQYGAKVVGAESPPYAQPTEKSLSGAASRMALAGADIVWVGLGTPKQDRVAHSLRALYPATYVCVGAAFDFLSGHKTEAPRWMRGSGLEWLHRFAAEPGRMARRYTIENAHFLAAVLRGPTRRL